jgi:NAD(P)-dependent dehydrogenase (short-subunit alcohol dehydrogenase family)
VDLELDGKRAIVTGGSRGIGLAIMQASGWGRIVNVSGLAARSTGSITGTVRNAAVAAVVAFLCSPKSVAINGDAIVVSGGAVGPIYY